MAIEIVSLAYYLQKNFDTVILYGEKEPGEKEVLYLLNAYPGLTLKKIPHLHKSFNIWQDVQSYRFILRELKSGNYHIIHTHGSKAGLLGRIAARAVHCDCVVHTFHGHLFHSYFNAFFSKLLVYTERRLVKITSHVIATSAQQKHELTAIYKICAPEKVSVIHLGVDTEVFFQQHNDEHNTFRQAYLDDDTIAVGIIARIVPIKNFPLFAEVVERIIKTIKIPVKFFVIGDGTMKADVQNILSTKAVHWCDTSAYNKQASVVFTSWIEQIMPVLNAMDIVVLTSNNEGTALALVEAQLCGKPVVATDVGGVKDTFIDNETGFIVKPGDIENFVIKLTQLITDKHLRETMGVKAAAFALDKFSKKTEVEKTSALYIECINKI